jgi:RND family efflux transporter MFP subunit
MSIENEPPKSRLIKQLKIAALIGGGVAIVIVLSGMVTRLYANRSVEHWTQSQEVPTVSVIKPQGSSGSGTLVLPGKLSAFYNAPIYARVPGYVRGWYKDIGAYVHKGDVLAVIDTPELDQQLEQARADLANAVAAQKLSSTTAKRWSSLLNIDAVSKQESEEKSGDLAAKNAQVAAAKANVQRIEDLTKFSKITAPFDGTVTNRSIDVGALVNAGSENAGTPLFTVADLHRIRIYVSVPQNYSADILPGMSASLTLPEYPGRVFHATLDSTSDAIGDQSNALLVELLADNTNGLLKPGDYAQVTLDLPKSASVLTVPASALVFDRQGLQVATVMPNNRVAMKSISLARDMGSSVEVSSGLRPNDRVIDNPPDSIVNDDLVRPQNAAAGR